MGFRTKAALGAGLALCLLLITGSGVQAQAPDAGHAPSEWKYLFPLFGKKLSQRGINLPLPFGVGLNYVYLDQPIKIDKIAIGVNDSEMVDISDLITFDDLSSKLHALNARLDLWVLPFLNVYVLGNYALNTKTSVSVVEPFEFDAGASQSGGGGGFGMTFAGGLWGFFGTLDLNWTWNKLQKLEDPVGTFLLTPRVGRNFGKLAGIEWIFWVGAMRQVIESDTRGSIHLKEAIDGARDGRFQDALQAWYDGLPPGRQALVQELVDRIDVGGNADPVIHYDLDKAVASRWNMLLGTELGLTAAWRLRAEVGFIQRFQLLVGFNYRFGGFSVSPEPEPTHAPPQSQILKQSIEEPANQGQP